MRSITQFAKVEGHTALVRDMSSHAILATDDNEFNAYQKKREVEKKRASLLQKQQEEIQSLRDDMLEIKQMLSSLISVKGAN